MQITDLKSYIGIINKHNGTAIMTVFPRKWFSGKISPTHTATIPHDSEPILDCKTDIYHLLLLFYLFQTCSF